MHRQKNGSNIFFLRNGSKLSSFTFVIQIWSNAWTSLMFKQQLGRKLFERPSYWRRGVWMRWKKSFKRKCGWVTTRPKKPEVSAGDTSFYLSFRVLAKWLGRLSGTAAPIQGLETHVWPGEIIKWANDDILVRNRPSQWRAQNLYTPQHSLTCHSRFGWTSA